MKALQLITVCLLASLPIIVPPANATSSLAQKLIVRRQSGETEKENTSNNKNNNGADGGSSSMQAGRLYPDLPQQQPGPVAPMYPGYPNFHGAPTPFVPFNPQPLSPSQLSDLQRRMQQQMPMQRPMSAAERLQSQSFTNGLGRRLLAMIGLDTQPEAAGAANESSPRQDQSSSSSMDQSAMRALQNVTVLQQLNGGVQSIYGSLSKMYNATVQQQLNLLQERFKKEAENSSAAAGANNPWQQRIAQQVPMFFKNMASKVGEAQENLNRIMAQMVARASGNSSSVVGSMQASSERSASTAAAANNQGFFNSFYNQFMNPDGMPPAGGNFFDQFGRSLGFSGPQQRAGPEGQAGQDLGSQLMSFWHNQVQPQIGMVRGQVARVWRELMASGALAPAESFVARSRSQLGLGSPAPNSEGSSSAPSSELVDEILKEVDMGNADFAILNSSAPTNGDSANQQQRPNSLSAQMQDRLISAQRELNQLWGGLTSSLQNAIGNVRNTLNPAAARQQSPFGAPLRPMASTNQESKQEADPEENEISGKVKDLSKLQREADTVHDVLKQQQQQQQQRPGFGDRFRSFFNNVDLANEFNQLQGRLGTAVGDLWNQIPRRWDMMMESMGPQSEMARARLMAATASPSRSSSTTTQKPETEATTSSN